jgi:hypothetical protein
MIGEKDYFDADRAVDAWWSKNMGTSMLGVVAGPPTMGTSVLGVVAGPPTPASLRALVHGLLDTERAKAGPWCQADVACLTSELATVRAELKEAQNSERRWYVEAHETLDTRSLRLIVQRDKALEQLALSEAQAPAVEAPKCDKPYGPTIHYPGGPGHAICQRPPHIGPCEPNELSRALADLQAAREEVARLQNEVVILTSIRDDRQVQAHAWREERATLTAERDRAVALLIMERAR